MKKLIRVLMSCCNEQQDSKQSDRDKTIDISNNKIAKKLMDNSPDTREVRTYSHTKPNIKITTTTNEETDSSAK